MTFKKKDMKKSTIQAGFQRVIKSQNCMRFIYFLAGIGVAGMFFCSCSPIQRHARIVEKYPFVHTQDTIIFRDTIRVEIPKVQLDTVLLLSQLRDTITIEKERLKIKLWTVHDKIYVQGICDTITIEKEVIRKVPIRYYVEKEKRSWLKFVILLGIVSFALYAVFRKRESKTTININEDENIKNVDSSNYK